MWRMENRKSMEQLVREAVRGSKDALEVIVRRMQEPVYSLCLRMLLNPTDAEDAAQEILTIVITKLGGYRFEGPFRAWVMRIAVNKLKAIRKTFMEKRISSVENLEEIMDRIAAKGWFSQPLQAPESCIEMETRFICTHAMLHTLDRSHRMAFILDVVMGVNSEEGGRILDITPAAYRKRLSRARRRIKEFMGKECGVFDAANRCRCGSISPVYLKKGWIDPEKPLFPSNPHDGLSPASLKSYLKELDEMGRLSAIYKTLPPSDFDFVSTLRDMHQSGRYRIISDPRLA
jgi:RNA polymerase sigma factor (sigma-70 family)